MKASVKAVAVLMFLLALVALGVTASSAQVQNNASQTSAPQQPTSGTAFPAQAVPAANQPPAATAVAGIPQSATAPETQSLHIQVGRSVVINVQSRMKRILVSNQAVLETVTVNPTQLAVSAKAPGSSSLVIWDESGHARILDVYADVDVSGLRDALAQAFPNDQIQVEADQGRVVLAGKVSSKAVADDAVKLSSGYGNVVVNSMVVAVPARAKQVMLKVRFAEVNRAKLSQFGFNIFSTGATNTIGVISTQQFGSFGQQQINDVTGPTSGRFGTQETIGDVLNLFVFRPDIHLGTVIRALQQKNVLEILAEPNLMARSGEPAKFLAGGEFPFPVVQSAGANAAGTAITIQFRPFGVRLEFTGTITDDNVVRLKIAPEVSALDFSNALQVSGFTVPAISTRRAETEVDLRDGQSFGIAGLLDQRTTSQMERIPGIGDIPILGQLFRSKQTNKSATELLVLVTPTIVDPLSSPVTAPKEPEMPIQHLDPKDFDKGVTKAPAAEKPSK